MSDRLRSHLLLTVFVIASRLVLHAVGLQFYFRLNWMWMADPSDLRERLLETLYYFHAFMPGMNLLTGVLLKAGGTHVVLLAQVLFWGLGLVLVNSLFYLASVSGLPTAGAWTVAAAFALLPQTIYFEHLYPYETPVTTFLCLSAVLFHRALRRQSLLGWLLFFSLCAAIALTRATFHLVWYVASILIVLACSEARARRVILIAASVPTAIVLGLYLKNLVMFGNFAASTFGPSSLTHITVSRLPLSVRDAWIREGKLSPFAAFSPYAPPRAYLGLVHAVPRQEWPPQLTRLQQASVDAPNFNNWLLLDVQRQRMKDAMYYLEQRPFDYFCTVVKGTADMFGPSTNWHPLDGTPDSPHFQHRQILGSYERWYNRIVHGFPISPVGLYIFLPVVWGWALWRARALRVSGSAEEVVQGGLLIFCLFQTTYVVVFTSIVTFLESARYRYQIEPFIWLVTALTVAGRPMLAGRRSTPLVEPERAAATRTIPPANRILNDE